MTNPNSATSPSDALKEGIRALRAGDRPRARELLTAIVTADEHNEQAWLWLSHAVDSDQERLICIENVLTLNPNNQQAQQALKKIEARRAKKQAAQRPPPPPPKPNKEKFQQYSELDDIWADAESLRLCPYCAEKITPADTTCPNCQNKLTVTFFAYEKPSTNLYIYGMLLFSLSILFAVQIVIDVLTEQPPEIILNHSVMIPVFMVLTIFVYLRHTWAHIASIAAVFVAAIYILATPYIDSVISDLFIGTLMEPTPIFGLAQGASVAATGAVRILQLGGLAFAGIYGIFIVPPDFARETMHLYAQYNKKITTATGAFLEGDRYAKRGMWAAAVLHYQRAAALDPHRLLYQLSLAQAYNELNFFERSMDVLQSANRTVTTPEAKAKIKELMIRVEVKQNQAESIPQK